MVSHATNPFPSMPDELELVEDPELTARRARLRRVFYAIVGPAAAATVALAVVHVAKPSRAAEPPVFVAPAAPSMPEQAGLVPAPDPAPSVVEPEGAVQLPAKPIKHKRSWARNPVLGSRADGTAEHRGSAPGRPGEARQ
jgi:hypothetical protein